MKRYIYILIPVLFMVMLVQPFIKEAFQSPNEPWYPLVNRDFKLGLNSNNSTATCLKEIRSIDLFFIVQFEVHDSYLDELRMIIENNTHWVNKAGISDVDYKNYLFDLVAVAECMNTVLEMYDEPETKMCIIENGEGDGDMDASIAIVNLDLGKVIYIRLTT